MRHHETRKRVKELPSVVITLLVLIVVGGVSIVLYSRYAGVKKGGAYSSAVSLWHELTHGDIFRSLQIPLTDDWRTLSAKEYEAVVLELVKRRFFDKGMSELRNGKHLLDPWGTPYQIAARKSPSDAAEVVVWSKGRDGKTGTADDVSYPKSGLQQLPTTVRSTGASRALRSNWSKSWAGQRIDLERRFRSGAGQL